MRSLFPESADFETGEVILMNKPKGWTSFDVVAKVRNLLKAKKIGHAGTLDPLATGLLILCTGKKTKTINEIQDAPKTYLATIKFGATTATYDAEVAEENVMDASHLKLADVEAILPSFSGEIDQIPPIYSAIKIEGKRSYDLARRDKAVELKARQITIYSLQVQSFTEPGILSLIVNCSKGTYIRSLAHDMGQRLGVGGYLVDLERTQIGAYSLEDALSVEEIVSRFRKSRVAPQDSDSHV